MHWPNFPELEGLWERNGWSQKRALMPSETNSRFLNPLPLVNAKVNLALSISY
jgi:hypothetical protein